MTLPSKFLIFIHMENLLIVLVFVASIVYKIYSNYKEEMAKSAKRNTQKQHSQKSMEHVPPVSAAQPHTVTPYIPQVNTQQTRNPFVTKSNTIQDIPEEVQRARQNRKVNPIDLVEKKELEAQPISFDLRQAVIQAAILDRPYK